jgi:hypothetical protein
MNDHVDAVEHVADRGRLEIATDDLPNGFAARGESLAEMPSNEAVRAGDRDDHAT